jgi:hypothetical protein
MSENRLPLSLEEKTTLEEFQTKVHQVIIDLGKIELQLSDLHNVKEQVKQVMTLLQVLLLLPKFLLLPLPL